MKWFRANIKHGTRLALLALAIQFVLAFGHFHPITAAQAAPEFQSALSQSDVPRSHDLVTTDPAGQSAERQQKPASDPGSSHAQDPCAICAVIAMANAVLFATPPLLLLPEAVEFLYRTTDAEFIHLNSVHVAFQPRAPPIS
ncbi:MAG TPA: DUF2946 family protein [Bradyrhizobium sp.]|nr:DUF2946 family protein [Bradyrhizobium sp.]